MSDPSGFRPLFTPFDECDYDLEDDNKPHFGYMRAASLEIMNNIAIGKAPHPTNAIAAYNQAGTDAEVSSAGRNLGVTVNNMVIDKPVQKAVNTVKPLKTIGVGFCTMYTSVGKNFGEKFLGFVSGKVGILSSAEFLTSGITNFRQYGLWEGLQRTGIDFVMLMGCVGLCALIPATASVGVTAVVTGIIGWGCDWLTRRIKRRVYGDQMF